MPHANTMSAPFDKYCFAEGVAALKSVRQPYLGWSPGNRCMMIQNPWTSREHLHPEHLHPPC
eukprot:1146874-Pelagomonas_calceolata.AAC.6